MYWIFEDEEVEDEPESTKQKDGESGAQEGDEEKKQAEEEGKEEAEQEQEDKEEEKDEGEDEGEQKDENTNQNGIKLLNKRKCFLFGVTFYVHVRELSANPDGAPQAQDAEAGDGAEGEDPNSLHPIEGRSIAAGKRRRWRSCLEL